MTPEGTKLLYQALLRLQDAKRELDKAHACLADLPDVGEQRDIAYSLSRLTNVIAGRLEDKLLEQRVAK